MSHGAPTAAAVMRSMVEMFRTGDVTSVRSIVSDNYVDHQGLGNGDIVGADGFGLVVRVARSAYETLDVSIEDLFAAEDRAVARLRWRGEKSSGEVIERETIDIVRVVDGSAVEHWGTECWSTAPDHQ